MSLENNVNELKADIQRHLRFYVVDYLGFDSDKERANFRGELIAQENSLLGSNTFDSAKLRVIEYLDSHPHEKQQAIEFVAALDRSQVIPSISAYYPHSDGGAVLQEQLHRLEGGFLVALVQWIYNENYRDPAVALDKGGLAVTIAGIAETAAEGKAGGIESARRFEEDQAHTQEFVKEAGKEEIHETLREIGGKSSANNWTNTAQELGNQRLQDLESTRGQAATGD